LVILQVIAFNAFTMLDVSQEDQSVCYKLTPANS